jgi:hypothetical protein
MNCGELESFSAEPLKLRNLPADQTSMKLDFSSVSGSVDCCQVVECPGCGVQETLDFTQGHPICDVCGFSMEIALPRDSFFKSLASWAFGKLDLGASHSRWPS